MSQINGLRECLEEWLQIHEMDYDYWFFTPSEWRSRGEAYLLDSELIFAAENQLIQSLHYGAAGELGNLETELQELAGGFGYYFEFGNHWNLGFYHLEGGTAFPPAGTAYSSLLKDLRWQQKRRRISSRSKERCEDCGAANLPLDVHHCYYRYGRFPWQYPDAALLHLCRACHAERQTMELKLRGTLPQLTTKELGTLRSALTNGMYWYPRAAFWAFIGSIGFNTDEMTAKISALLPLRSHKDGRAETRYKK